MVYSPPVKTNTGRRSRQTGIRAKMQDAMDPVRFRFPRGEVRRKINGVMKMRPLINHPIRWYLDGHLVRRPLNGLYALGQFAEYMLAYARSGCRGQQRAVVQATSFFAATRRAMDSVIRGNRAGSRMTRDALSSLSRKVLKLTADAVATYEIMYGEGSVDTRLTPTTGM